MHSAEEIDCIERLMAHRHVANIEALLFYPGGKFKRRMHTLHDARGDPSAHWAWRDVKLRATVEALLKRFCGAHWPPGGPLDIRLYVPLPSEDASHNGSVDALLKAHERTPVVAQRPYGGRNGDLRRAAEDVARDGLIMSVVGGEDECLFYLRERGGGVYEIVNSFG